jgi:hypothetical protein
MKLKRRKIAAVNRVGNGISFEKISRNRLGSVSVISRKKALIPKGEGGGTDETLKKKDRSCK